MFDIQVLSKYFIVGSASSQQSLAVVMRWHGMSGIDIFLVQLVQPLSTEYNMLTQVQLQH